MIGCLALLLAGCCNREPLDNRLVGDWVLDDRHYSEGLDDGSRAVRRIYADGTMSTNWAYDVEEDEIYLRVAPEYDWLLEWGTFDGCEVWFGQNRPDYGNSYKVKRKKLSINFRSRLEGDEGVSESFIEAGIFDYWRYD